MNRRIVHSTIALLTLMLLVGGSVQPAKRCECDCRLDGNTDHEPREKRAMVQQHRLYCRSNDT
jgi:hypothetical protein